MKTVIQRVKKATLIVEDKLISAIDKGLVVYFGVEQGDTQDKATYLARKIANMRIFEDENGKMNLSVKDVKGSILLVSQFTLCANCAKGNRPDYFGAEAPSLAEKMYLEFGAMLASYDVPVRYGVFGADMAITQINNGPVTIPLNA
ncbi:MAG: D-aminoacyl-tRNA deacylase [Bacillota bacterium]